MSRTLPISDDDIRNVVHMLGDVAGMTTELAVRRRYIADGLTQLVGGDIWCWVISRMDRERGYPGPFVVMDGQWRDEAERAKFYHACRDPEFNAAAASIDWTRHKTYRFGPDEPAFADATFRERIAQMSGFSSSVLSSYPLSDQMVSTIGFNRRIGTEPYGQREIALIHLIIGQIDWLHREGLDDISANSPSILGLTPRQSEVLVHLLAGDGVKQIARKLDISEYTVKDHAKALHRHFNVESRSELLAKFISAN